MRARRRGRKFWTLHHVGSRLRRRQHAGSKGVYCPVTAWRRCVRQRIRKSGRKHGSGRTSPRTRYDNTRLILSFSARNRRTHTCKPLSTLDATPKRGTEARAICGVSSTNFKRLGLTNWTGNNNIVQTRASDDRRRGRSVRIDVRVADSRETIDGSSNDFRRSSRRGAKENSENTNCHGTGAERSELKKRIHGRRLKDTFRTADLPSVLATETGWSDFFFYENNKTEFP